MSTGETLPFQSFKVMYNFLTTKRLCFWRVFSGEHIALQVDKVIMELSRSCPQAAPAPNDGWVHLVEKIDQLNRNGGFLLPLWGLLRDSFPRSTKICVFNLRSLTIFLSPTSHEVQFNCSFNFLLLQYLVNLLYLAIPLSFPFMNGKNQLHSLHKAFSKVFPSGLHLI